MGTAGITGQMYLFASDDCKEPIAGPVCPTATGASLRDAQLAKLDAMERELASLDLPERFADRWYTLREHLAEARDLLLRLRAR